MMIASHTVSTGFVLKIHVSAPIFEVQNLTFAIFDLDHVTYVTLCTRGSHYRW